MKQKLDFMYNYADFDNDRITMRTKFLKEMNKKTSLKDIGETLDDLVLDNKAKNWKYYNVTKNHKDGSKRAEQDFTSEDFSWSGRVMKMTDPKAPLFYEDPSILDKADPDFKNHLHKLNDKI
jgi:small subunit ribosomal protein S9